jgi:hypothetical protein
VRWERAGAVYVFCIVIAATRERHGGEPLQATGRARSKKKKKLKKKIKKKIEQFR